MACPLIRNRFKGSTYEKSGPATAEAKALESDLSKMLAQRDAQDRGLAAVTTVVVTAMTNDLDISSVSTIHRSSHF